MKKVLLTLGFIGTVAIANAQISKGTIAVGGSLNFSTTSGEEVTTGGPITVTDEDPSVMKFGIGPKVAYYLTDNLAIGLGLSYSMESTAFPKDTAADTERTVSSSMITVAPMVRYNMPISDKFGAFLDAHASFGFGGMEDEIKGGATTLTMESDMSSMDIAVRPGLLYFLKDNLAIEAHYGRLGYSSETTNSKPTPTVEVEDTTGTFGLDLSTNSLSFGFMWYFGGGK